MVLQTSILFTLSFFAASVTAAPRSGNHFVPVARAEEDVPVRENGYIVKLKPSAEFNADRLPPSALNSVDNAEDTGVVITHEFPTLNAFAGTFSEEALAALQTDPEVEAIEPDTIGGLDHLAQQINAPWGLQRINQAGKLNRTATGALDYIYTYDQRAGLGVDVYVVDSGININHEEFEGRASWGKTFGGYTPDVDGNGHGTHVAGTVAGKTFGVAKRANVIALRVLSAGGSGFVSDTIAAVEYATQQAAITKKASVITISLRFSPSDLLDAAVTKAVENGLIVTVSAGNANTLSSTQSPARAAAAITVGATDINDARASYSNYGPGVDIFAPGSNVLSSYLGSNTATASLSGTSMATPHIAGLVAYFISVKGLQPAETILGFIKERGPDGLLTNIPADTVNELANNGVVLCSSLQRTSCENFP